MDKVSDYMETVFASSLIPMESFSVKDLQIRAVSMQIML